jgi:putative acetyltransferase
MLVRSREVSVSQTASSGTPYATWACERWRTWDPEPVAIALSIDDPADPEIRALLERHLTFAHEVTPAGGVFALDVEALRGPEVTFFCARQGGRLLGVLKSMHTVEEVRRQGVGRALVAHVLEVARDRGYRRVSLETGNFPAFAPARALYGLCGFTSCGPYGPYVGSETSSCMTISLDIASR